MTIEDLKNQIEADEIPDDFMIFRYADNTFLVNQFLDEICSRKGCITKTIDSIFTQTESALSLVFDSDTDISVVKVEEFSEVADNYDRFKNIIVVCSSVSKKIAAEVKDYIIDFPKLVDWQILDYMHFLCPGLTDDDYNWLFTATGGNIYRIVNELDKLKLFDEPERPIIFDKLKNDEASDLFAQTLFMLTDAIATKNRRAIYEYLTHAKYLEYDPIALINTLVGKYKNIAYVCLGSGLTAEQLGMKQNTYNGIKYYNKGYSAESVYKALQFLSDLDTRLKNNRLDCDSEALISYVINKMLA